MKLPEELAGRLPQGEISFRFAVLNGEVTVLSVSREGKELDLRPSDRDASGESKR